jgi:polyhydroxyalkanoate synthase subunit PhaC
MNAERQDGSWWQEWASWADECAGRFGPPSPPMGSQRYPALGEAPGDYVRG